MGGILMSSAGTIFQELEIQAHPEKFVSETMDRNSAANNQDQQNIAKWRTRLVSKLKTQQTEISEAMKTNTDPHRAELLRTLLEKNHRVLSRLEAE